MNINSLIASLRDEIDNLENNVDEWKEPSTEVRMAIGKRYNTFTGNFIYHDDEGIIVSKEDAGRWKYYMGFEYVKEFNITTYPDGAVKFSSDSDRVEYVLQLIRDNETETSNETETTAIDEV